MKKCYPILFLFLCTGILTGQETNCDCIEELNTISEEITEAKSYKIQVKRKDREEDLLKWKEEIAKEIRNDSLSQFFCVGYLQKYISFIKDKHNQVYSVPDKIPSNFPNYSSEMEGEREFDDSISGVYHAGSESLLVEEAGDDEWRGILLKSGYDKWKKGDLRMRISRKPDGSFEIFEFYPNGMLFYQDNIKISNGRIHSTFWNKQDKYFFNKNHEEDFSYKTLNPDFDYIGIRTLSRTRDLMDRADEFYDNTLSGLRKDNLIIDLRNNGGGAILQAKPLLKAIKRNKEIEKIYVMINFKTGSSAELTALELKEDDRTIIVGENSRGMLTYGYGNRSHSGVTDCGTKYSFSTKRTNRKLEEYEYVGIKPDLYLKNTTDWIEQVLAL